MKSKIISLFAVAACLGTSPVRADQALANTKGCTACHDMASKKIGPSYQDIAKKYAGQKDAPATLAKNILDGSKGVWGEMPMPATKTLGVSEADAKKLVAWILQQK